MSTPEAIRLLVQAIINIDEGHETVKKDSPIYNAMRNIIGIRGVVKCLEYGPEMVEFIEGIAESDSNKDKSISLLNRMSEGK